MDAHGGQGPVSPVRELQEKVTKNAATKHTYKRETALRMMRAQFLKFCLA